MKHSVERKLGLKPELNYQTTMQRVKPRDATQRLYCLSELSTLNRALYRTMETVHLLTGFYKNRRSASRLHIY